MRKFTPSDPHSRVTFAAQGAESLIVVEPGFETNDPSVALACEAHPLVTDLGGEIDPEPETYTEPEPEPDLGQHDDEHADD